MWKGYAYVLLAAAMWGCLGPAARFAFAEGATPLEAAFWRAAFGAALFGIHCLVKGGFHVRRRDLPVLLGFGLVGVSVFFGAYQAAVKEGGAALASVLLYTAPAWVAVLSRLVFKEALTGRKLVALSAAMAGTLLLALGGGGDLRPGAGAIGFGLLAGLTYALHFILGKRYLRDYSGATLYCLFLPVGGAGALTFRGVPEHGVDRLGRVRVPGAGLHLRRVYVLLRRAQDSGSHPGGRGGDV